MFETVIGSAKSVRLLNKATIKRWFRVHPSILFIGLVIQTSPPATDEATASEQNVERCAAFMSAKRRLQDEIEGLEIYSERYNCLRRRVDHEKEHILHKGTKETSQYRIMFYKQNRFGADDRLNYSIGLVTWTYEGRPPKCFFGIYRGTNLRPSDRLGKRFERYVMDGGWKRGFDRSLRRQEHRNSTWGDVANWIAVATAQRLVARHCKVESLGWRAKGIYGSIE